MIDLSVDFAGVELKNPLLVASADIGRDIRQIRKAEKYGASAVIVKGMFPDNSSELNSVMRVLLDEKGYHCILFRRGKQIELYTGCGGYQGCEKRDADEDRGLHPLSAPA